MGALPRPDLPPGPQRDLADALHGLHHRAGWPSLRVLAREAGCSHTTVSVVFSSPRLPSWGVLELLVEAMGGDVEAFRGLWQAAGSPAGSPVAAHPVTARIAGRVPELATVCRHLTAGEPGLLLVTGEAGIGKTRLVNSARAVASDQVFVGGGTCLPLSTDVPLLPIATLLRAAYGADHGQWLKEALTDAAPYVSASLRRLLPELDLIVDAPDEPDDEWSRQRLFTAVGSTLAGLAALRPFAVVIEDLHWADATTLDLLEHLLTTGPGVPVVGTWRQDDPKVPVPTFEWFSRVRRLPVVDELALRPLTREGTAEQLALLTGADPDPASVDRIHLRSQGQPLFTEQLAAQSDGQPMPEILVDLLDQRLAGLGRRAWSIARALGVADRALDDGLLTDITGLNSRDLAAGLHELGDRRLLRPSTGHLVELGHPLQAEAVRRRLVAPEFVAEHRGIAGALGRSADPSAAEVAAHWQLAEDPAEEIVWRIHAACSAAERFAPDQAAAEWRRVLELWPGADETAGSPPVRKSEAYLAAVDALSSVDVAAAWEVAEEGMRRLPDVTDEDAAEHFERAAAIKGRMGDPVGALVLADRAIALHEPFTPSVGYVRALHERRMALAALGRYDEARDTSALALAACAEIEAPQLLRRLLIERAIDETELSDRDRRARLDAADAVELTTPDPEGDIHLAVIRTHLLMMAGRVGEEVVAVGRPGLEAAAAWGLKTIHTSFLRANMSAALRLAGEVDRAAELIDPLTLGDQPTYEDAEVQAERASLDMLRGRCTEALGRLDAVAALPVSSLTNQLESAEYDATVDLWCGRPRTALDRLVAVLRESMATDASAWSSAVLALAARAAADVADAPGAGDATRRDLHVRLWLLLDQAQVDPFAQSGYFEARQAHGAAFGAEMARLAGRSSMDLWAETVPHWDRLGRMHDAAYCRWRGAQAALTAGQGTIALRLLRRAEREAREHVPLSAAIAETKEKARRAPQER